MKNVQLEHSSHKPANRKYPICFLAHNIDVPMNVGSLFRIADALGVEKVYLTGSSITPPNPKIRKTSRSTESHVSYEYAKDPISIVKALKRDGYKIISLEITTQSIAIQNLSLSKNDKICLIVGSENSGVSQELLDFSDETVHIPMLGVNSSMNVANACSIATYAITRNLE